MVLDQIKVVCPLRVGGETLTPTHSSSCTCGLQVRKGHTAPVYVINLLLSDVLQICCFICLVLDSALVVYLYLFGEMASVGFMVCIALERYLVVARPFWYRFSRSVHMSVLVCVVVWLLPLVYVLPLYLGVDSVVVESVFAVFHLLPLPLLLFFLIGTFKGLSKATRLPLGEKRRIMAAVLLVFVIYFLLFLPSILWSLVEEFREDDVFSDAASVLLFLSPVADLCLYVFIRKGAPHKRLTCLKVETDDDGSSA
uniref:G-protein coupled receptors family 1 profile domain-containing protein n=1 Tax=Sphaeramia orbicularis TaxID=375764 RepID=A0A672ZUE5_9TELE